MFQEYCIICHDLHASSANCDETTKPSCCINSAILLILFLIPETAVSSAAELALLAFIIMFV